MDAKPGLKDYFTEEEWKVVDVINEACQAYQTYLKTGKEDTEMLETFKEFTEIGEQTAEELGLDYQQLKDKRKSILMTWAKEKEMRERKLQSEMRLLEYRIKRNNKAVQRPPPDQEAHLEKEISPEREMFRDRSPSPRTKEKDSGASLFQPDSAARKGSRKSLNKKVT